MSIIICKIHGWQGGEKVSKILNDEFSSGQDIAERVRDFSFIMEDYECPFYGLEEEIEQLPEACVNGDFIIESDERLDEVLARITVMCGSCLKEAMKGAPLPVKDVGP